MKQQTNGTRNFLIGFTVCGVLLIGIVATLNFREALQNQPTATPPATLTPIPGVIEVMPPRELLDFTLPASTGEDVSLSGLQGNYTLLFFGYTHCPDFCPTTLATWKRIKEELGEAGAQVNYVFVSVDGERDTPEVLARYLERFDDAFIGLTGNPEVLAEIAPDYGLDYALNKEEGENYSVDHTTRTFLIDRQGRLVDVFSFDVPQSIIVAEIQQEMAT
jgi:protein SCO1/2